MVTNYGSSCRRIEWISSAPMSTVASAVLPIALPAAGRLPVDCDAVRVAQFVLVDW